MKTNDLPKVVRSEFRNFDFEELARRIMRADGLHYSIIIDDDGELCWDVDVDRVARGSKSLEIMPCPYYPEPVDSEAELRSLVKELKGMLYDKIMSIPDSYWVCYVI